MNVLFSSPNIYDARVYLPIAFLNIKTYVDKYTDLDVNWLEPLFRNRDADRMLEGVDLESIDFLGLSCYEWNWNLNVEIAKKIKAANPSCHVVAGGPHADYMNPKFWDMYPMIDTVVHHDGEIPFAELLQGKTEIGGTATRDGVWPMQLVTNFQYSPWLENKEWILNFREKYINHPDTQTMVIMWETDRGCPFKCSFCDWGMQTMQKVRRIPMERVKAEIDFFADELKVPYLWHVGANLGIMPRDLDIVKYLQERHSDTGWPRAVQYNPSKNTPERSLEIGQIFHDMGVVNKHLISLQHTKQNVLDCIDRDNIPVERQIPIIRETVKRKMPVVSQLIMGMPGDNVESWMGALADSIEWGIHNECQVYDFEMLPNAPANKPEYKDKWKIKTIKRKHLPHERFMRQDDVLQETEFIIGTSTFTPDDWVTMKLYGKMFVTCHTGNLTKYLAMYLRNTQGVKYYDFYKNLFDDLMDLPLIVDAKQKIHDYLDNEDLLLEEKIDKIPNSVEYDLEERFLIEWLYDDDWQVNNQFFDYVKLHITDFYEWNDELEDLFRVTKEMFLTIDYNKKQGKKVHMNYNWIDYLEQCNLACHTEDNVPKIYPAKGEKVWKTNQNKVTLSADIKGINIKWKNVNEFVDTVIASRYQRGNRNILFEGEFID